MDGNADAAAEWILVCEMQKGGCYALMPMTTEIRLKEKMVKRKGRERANNIFKMK